MFSPSQLTAQRRPARGLCHLGCAASMSRSGVRLGPGDITSAHTGRRRLMFSKYRWEEARVSDIQPVFPKGASALPVPSCSLHTACQPVSPSFLFCHHMNSQPLILVSSPTGRPEAKTPPWLSQERFPSGYSSWALSPQLPHGHGCRQQRTPWIETEYGCPSDPAGKPHIALGIRDHLSGERELQDPGSGSGTGETPRCKILCYQSNGRTQNHRNTSSTQHGSPLPKHPNWYWSSF